MSHASSDPNDIDQPAGPALTGTPRWVKVSGIVALAVLLLFAAMMVFGGGGHGPGRHSGGGTDTPSGATETEGHIPPEGHG